MFQKDYWKLNDAELSNLASKHNIPPMSFVLSIIAIFLSIAAFVKSFFPAAG